MYPNTRKNKACLKSQAKINEKPDLLSIHDSREYDVVRENQTHNVKFDPIYNDLVNARKQQKLNNLTASTKPTQSTLLSHNQTSPTQTLVKHPQPPIISHKIEKLLEAEEKPQEILDDKAAKAKANQIKQIKSSVDAMNKKQKQKYNIGDSLQTLEGIGKGGQGEVFRMIDPATKQIYAKKVVVRKKSSSSFDTKAINEIAVLLVIMMVDDPMLLRIYNIEYVEGEKYSILMEYGQGDLSSYNKYRQAKGFQWSLNEIVGISTQIVDQVERFRKIGIYHRDIKPHNVILCGGILKLTDFSLSRHSKKGDVQYITPCGTRGFWAPEVESAYISQKKIELNLFESDIYSIGKSLETMVSWSPLSTSPEFIRIRDDFCIKRRTSVLQTFLFCHESLNEWTQYLEDFKIFHLANHVAKLELRTAKRTIEIMWENKMNIECKHWITILLNIIACRNEKDVRCFAAALWTFLGFLHENEGDLHQAMKDHNQALTIKLEEYGTSHKEVGKSYHNLGGIYMKLGFVEKALEFYFASLKIKQVFGGANDLEIAKLYHIIGNLLNHLGNYEKSFEFLHKSLEIRLALQGQSHKDIPNLQSLIANVLCRLGKYDDALAYYNKALANRVLNNDIPTEISLNYSNIANIEYACHRFPSAYENYQKALEYRLKANEEPNYELAELYQSLGNVCQKLGFIEDSLPHYHKNLETRIAIFGASNLLVSATYMTLGSTYQLLGKSQEALENYTSSLEIKRAILGDLHPEVAKCYNLLGSVYLGMECFEYAQQYFLFAMDIQVKNGIANLDLADTYFNLGSAFSHTNQETALEYYRKSLEIKSMFLEEDDPQLALIKKIIEDLVFRENTESEFPFEFLSDFANKEIFQLIP